MELVKLSNNTVPFRIDERNINFAMYDSFKYTSLIKPLVIAAFKNNSNTGIKVLAKRYQVTTGTIDHIKKEYFRSVKNTSETTDTLE